MFTDVNMENYAAMRVRNVGVNPPIPSKISFHNYNYISGLLSTECQREK